MELRASLTAAFQQVGGAWVFYTCLPLPAKLPLQFTRIARWATGIGLVLGALLGLADFGLGLLQMPLLPRSALIVALWVGLTGGLHLDGAMDTADGLAVMQPDRRLEVMADSRSGAFGVMVAVIILSLKVCALSAVPVYRPLVLMLAAAWGRWGQMVAIATYPYLKPEGKGAFHRQHLQLPWDFIPGLMILTGLASFHALIDTPLEAGLTLIAAALISAGTGLWFNQQLSGMTGDVYGAIVEWTEALLLCVFTLPILHSTNFI
ncbi:Adenosylcobinamide-GDP ribazoletransferase [Acaryochloris thomasi RCC1774]|uniref:Adenosylcobinamide-GDP ribazoletransferase n=1 Tax=Acaryochloris thomasi RCC1774 TaxID=1764569 RepID=A0A2W1JCI2_9CYAN|nr:adenosylcobinamide-GDP ribazoletransferase [Acaryochloris thomasi]PZD71653.1 Adenosylcobinamide-GDP ribazoletransferase [Acaryochloris thomasi RCC1774]